VGIGFHRKGHIIAWMYNFQYNHHLSDYITFELLKSLRR
jgi:hypothetical protein